MLERGYFTLVRVRGVPVRLHWTLPIGMLLLSGLRFAPGAWIGVALLIAIHEAGHAILVHRMGLSNLGIDLTGFGGRCRYAGDPTPLQRSVIAWGGVIAQLALLLVTYGLIAVFGVPSIPFADDLADIFTRANLILIAINLLPIPPLDGAEAWPLLAYFRRKRRWKQKFAKGQTLREAFRDSHDRE
jgi:stage IV sporulation protein FB